MRVNSIKISKELTLIIVLVMLLLSVIFIYFSEINIGMKIGYDVPVNKLI